MKKIITSMLLVIFFIGCKKESIEKLIKQEKGVTVNDAKVFLNNLSDLKTESENGHGFNPKSLLEKIDWKNASQIDSGKILIGKFDGAPTENGTKLGFRKVVFDKNADGEISLYILEFAPDIFHLWKYKGINKKSFDGKIIVYDQNYKLVHGYVLKAGKIIGEILPVKQNTIQVDSDIKNDISITTCTQSGGSRINSEGYEEAYILLSCNTEYFFNHGNHVSNQLQQVEGESVDEFIGGGGGTAEVPVPPMIIPGQDNDPIDVKKFTKCFEVPSQLMDEFKFSLYVDQPVNGSTASSYGGNVGHTFIGITKISGNTSFTQYIGFYPENDFSGILPLGHAFKDNGKSEYDVSITLNLTLNQMQLLVNAINGYNSEYDVWTNNCTNFALQMASAAGLYIPNSQGNSFISRTPGQLGEDLRAYNKQWPGVGVNENGGKTGLSKGACN